MPLRLDGDREIPHMDLSPADGVGPGDHEGNVHVDLRGEVSWGRAAGIRAGPGVRRVIEAQDPGIGSRNYTSRPAYCELNTAG